MDGPLSTPTLDASAVGAALIHFRALTTEPWRYYYAQGTCLLLGRDAANVHVVAAGRDVAPVHALLDLRTHCLHLGNGESISVTQADGRVVVLDRRRPRVILDDLARVMIGRTEFLYDVAPVGLMRGFEPQDSRRVVYDESGLGRLVNLSYPSTAPPVSTPPASLARPLECAEYANFVSTPAASSPTQVIAVAQPTRPPLVTISSAVSVDYTALSLDIAPISARDDSAIDLGADVAVKPRPLVDYASSSPPRPVKSSTYRRQRQSTILAPATDEAFPPTPHGSQSYTTANPSSPCAGTALGRRRSHAAVRARAATAEDPTAIFPPTAEEQDFEPDGRISQHTPASRTPASGPRRSHESERIEFSATPSRPARVPKHLRKTPLLSLRKPKTPVFVIPSAPRRLRKI